MEVFVPTWLLIIGGVAGLACFGGVILVVMLMASGGRKDQK